MPITDMTAAYSSVDFDKLFSDLHQLDLSKTHNVFTYGTIFDAGLEDNAIVLINELSKMMPNEKIPYRIFDKLYNGNTGIFITHIVLEDELFLRIKQNGQFSAIFPIDITTVSDDFFYTQKPSIKIETSKYDMYLYCGAPQNAYVIMIINSYSHNVVYEKYTFDGDNYMALREANLFTDEELDKIIASIDANKILMNICRQNEKECTS